MRDTKEQLLDIYMAIGDLIEDYYQAYLNKISERKEMINIINSQIIQAIRDKEHNRLIISVLCELTYENIFKTMYKDEDAQNIIILETLLANLKLKEKDHASQSKENR